MTILIETKLLLNVKKLNWAKMNNNSMPTTSAEYNFLNSNTFPSKNLFWFKYIKFVIICRFYFVFIAALK